MTTGRTAVGRLAFLLCVSSLVSGCANMLYTPSNAALNDPDASGCDPQAMEDALVKSCRRLTDGSPVPSAAPFSEVVRHKTVADPYKLESKPSSVSQFVFELTPLGFFSPLFGYPPKETVYTGVVEPAGAPKFPFRVKAGETFTKSVPLSDQGPATYSIRCRSRGCALTTTAPAKPPFADDIAAFEAADRAHAPPKDAVLFVGSSSIRFWESLEKDFPGVPVIDRGFGGSTIADCARYADRIVVPYRPRRIVFYAGDNDIAAGRAPALVAADFTAFVRQVRAALPGVPILFISVKPSLARWTLAAQIRETNRLVREAAAKEDFDFLDAYAPMLGADGLPRKELFREDGLHMTPEGYALWTRLVDPFVRASR